MTTLEVGRRAGAWTLVQLDEEVQPDGCVRFFAAVAKDDGTRLVSRQYLDAILAGTRIAESPGSARRLFHEVVALDLEELGTQEAVYMQAIA